MYAAEPRLDSSSAPRSPTHSLLPLLSFPLLVQAVRSPLIAAHPSLLRDRLWHLHDSQYP